MTSMLTTKGEIQARNYDLPTIVMMEEMATDECTYKYIYREIHVYN